MLEAGSVDHAWAILLPDAKINAHNYFIFLVRIGGFLRAVVQKGVHAGNVRRTQHQRNSLPQGAAADSRTSGFHQEVAVAARVTVQVLAGRLDLRSTQP
jgi:hypothetical protein